jgi:single-stranded-DNA-specific exonuclease
MTVTSETQACRWNVQPAHEKAMSLAAALKISPLLGQVLVNRGIDTPEAGHDFLSPKLTALLRPETLPGMAAAVQRLRQALENEEKITLYGDYDVDGITGVSILLSLLNHLRGRADYYIPHRLDEGYGLNEEAIRSLAAGGTQLVITVDCGISAVDVADLAADLGMDMIITDHHQPGPALPRAAAIVHPLLDAEYANPDSAGAMVAFKLAWALADALAPGPRLPDDLRRIMLEATSLAAVGTVADVVDLRGENRILTHYGLRSLAQSQLCGVQALFASAGLAGKGVDSYDVGFKLGPMLNAAGRMGHARLAVELLSCSNERRAQEIADYLRQQNQLRQQCGRKVFKEACQRVTAQGMHLPERRSIVLGGEDWHRGVLGIVASRLVEKYCRPAIVVNRLHDGSGLAQGSGRSIAGFSMLDAIRACQDHLVSFGGHTMAAGVTLETERVDAFAEAFEAYAAEAIAPEDLTPQLTIDALTPLSSLSMDTLQQLQRLGPFGAGNARPVFATRGVQLISPPRRVGAQGDHLQLSITDNTQALRCIGFGMGKLEKKLLDVETFDIAYEADINSYNGRSQVQLVLTDVRLETAAM